ncbi:hypothetical protein [Shewanella donghaensis]|uniref:hypothetical protein n=1 Tax=Shewanella donghaensis TaxID=238836 RepID=UPI00131522AC|nr:hypothetical protein [Shewanella donghaensis]
MAKFHSVKRSKREAWMQNWPFNMDVICFRRAHMDVFTACLAVVSAHKVALSHPCDRDIRISYTAPAAGNGLD